MRDANHAAVPAAELRRIQHTHHVADVFQVRRPRRQEPQS